MSRNYAPEKPNCILEDEHGRFKAYICDKTGQVWYMEEDAPIFKYTQRWGEPFWADTLRLPLEGNEHGDPVEKPSHYNQDGIECIDAIRASLGPEGFEAYCKGNCMKYLWRYKYKNGLEDLKKAQVYLGWMIETVEKDS